MRLKDDERRFLKSMQGGIHTHLHRLESANNVRHLYQRNSESTGFFAVKGNLQRKARNLTPAQTSPRK